MRFIMQSVTDDRIKVDVIYVRMDSMEYMRSNCFINFGVKVTWIMWWSTNSSCSKACITRLYLIFLSCMLLFQEKCLQSHWFVTVYKHDIYLEDSKVCIIKIISDTCPDQNGLKEGDALRTIAFHIHLECTIKKIQEYLAVL